MNQAQLMEHVDAHAKAMVGVEDNPGSDSWLQIEREARATLDAAIGELFAELEKLRAARTE